MCLHCSIYLFVTCFTQQPIANSSNHLPARWGIHVFPFQQVTARGRSCDEALVDEKHFKKMLKQTLKYA